ncbi:TPA: hypothetical protein GRR58_24570 [Vibrio parahaemolyticus]|nr:hypothetical protein [Vibrio parahaemolyticus]HAS6511067.1 hypothetical protein [Vibrio parahaemolyticus]HAS6516161.1 hypothetical protein [Vibrio parahaemolyticus]HAS6526153.1 hypothetical protein [Vibrio parahaemolyticus]HAS6540981.1 hypothetical protein [Vibrio parahaemolyticus]
MRHILYVGQTVQPIQDRMYQGISSQDYKWAKKSTSYDLLVWNLCGLVESESNYDLDSIEAELAFLVRVIQNEWPTYQNSINFRWRLTSNLGNDARKVAEMMLIQFYDYLIKKLVDKGSSTAAIKAEKANLKNIFKIVN